MCEEKKEHLDRLRVLYGKVTRKPDIKTCHFPLRPSWQKVMTSIIRLGVKTMEKKHPGKKKDIPMGEDRGLYREEIGVLISAPHLFRKKTSAAIRKADLHQLVLLLLWDTWVRETELCYIKIEHIDLENRTITLHKTKAHIIGKEDGEFITESKPRKVSFSQEAATLIERVTVGRKRGYLFIGQSSKRLSSRTVRHIVNTYAELTGIQRITGYYKNGKPRYLVHAHAIREAGEAYSVLMGGMNERTAARKAGHSMETQKRYYLKYDIIRQRMEADKARKKLQAQFGSIY